MSCDGSSCRCMLSGIQQDEQYRAEHNQGLFGQALIVCKTALRLLWAAVSIDLLHQHPKTFRQFMIHTPGHQLFGRLSL